MNPATSSLQSATSLSLSTRSLLGVSLAARVQFNDALDIQDQEACPWFKLPTQVSYFDFPQKSRPTTDLVELYLPDSYLPPLYGLEMYRNHQNSICEYCRGFRADGLGPTCNGLKQALRHLPFLAGLTLVLEMQSLVNHLHPRQHRLHRSLRHFDLLHSPSHRLRKSI